MKTPSKTTNTQSIDTSPAPPINFRLAFLFWLKLGFISFGGPAGQIAIMHQELVEKRRWISERRFLHALNYCMVLPGPEAQQLATYIGWLFHKTWGGIVAGVLFVLPSLVLLIALSWVYIAFGDVTWVEGIFFGIKPAVTAIVLHAAHRIGSRALKNKTLWAISIVSFLLIFVVNIPFPYIVLMAALTGWIGGRVAPHIFAIGSQHASKEKSYGPALIDDHTPIPSHAKFRWSNLSAVLIVGGLLWLAPMAALFVGSGWDHPYTQMAWFFTKAALLTFGGAYAVLPYVYQGAVGYYGWLTPTQMIDGLALGETTPGPLIMIVAFVAFVGGYTLSPLGIEMNFVSGAIAATIVTWFTFLPSFLFILAGAPLVESTHGNIKLTAPLTAITAAVVGVIVNLALFFGYHVLWPTGFSGQFDWVSAVISVAAVVALVKFKRSVLEVIGVSALLGLGLKLLSV